MKKKVIYLMLLLLVIASLPQNTSGVEVQQTLEFEEYIEIHSSTIIGTDYFITWSITQDDPDVYVEVFALDEGNFTNFQNGWAHLRYYLSVSYDPATSGYFIPNHDSTWYIIFQNVDAPMFRSTTVTAKVEFEEKFPQQNDGNSGSDAGNSIGNALYLYEDDYNCSGMLVYQDWWDYYRFYTKENDTVTISVSDLYDGNCNFYLIDPVLYNIRESRESITTNLEISIQIDQTGYWIIEFNKTEFSYIEKETYNLQIEIDSPLTETSTPTNQSGYHFTTIVSISLLSLICTIVIRKKRKSH
ncbi:MAG: hypothetical protein FK730_15360 [Asgard group archaeon]|nr:hypothetical protein [Asgard group archaeon]